MDKVITVFFALAYILLAQFIAGLGTVHGPQLFPYFVLGYLCITEVALWFWYFFVRRRGTKRKRWMLVGGGLGLAIALTAAPDATERSLSHWETARLEQQEAATQVFDIRDELLLSQKGNPIGIRLRYSMRFPKDRFFGDHFSQIAVLSPEGGPWFWSPVDGNHFAGNWVDGRLTNLLIEPRMAFDYGGGLRDVGGYGNGLRYVEGRVYHFTTDFLPEFLMWNPQKSRLCIVKPPPEYASGFERFLANETLIRYRITISGTKYVGITKNSYRLRTFYESAVKEGAAELEGVGFGDAIGSCK